MPDKMFRISRDGIILDIQETPASAVQPVQAKVGKSVYDDPAPCELIERLMAAGRLALDTGELQTIEWSSRTRVNCRHMEGRFMPSGDDEFFVVVRDVTERNSQEVEQAALHRVALAVASEARPEQIFDLVAEEIARVLGAHTTNLIRYEAGGTRRSSSAAGASRAPWLSDRRAVSARGALRPRSCTKTGRPGRRERGRRGCRRLAEEMRKLDVQSLVAVPVKLTGRPWGAVVATLMTPDSSHRAPRRDSAPSPA